MSQEEEDNEETKCGHNITNIALRPAEAGGGGYHLHELLCLIIFFKNLDTDLEHLHKPTSLMHCKFSYSSLLAEAVLIIRCLSLSNPPPPRLHCCKSLLFTSLLAIKSPPPPTNSCLLSSCSCTRFELHSKNLRSPARSRVWIGVGPRFFFLTLFHPSLILIDSFDSKTIFQS